METLLHDLSWVLPLRNETLTLIFNGFTFLGYLPFFLLFLPMGYWLGDKKTFTRLTILVGIVALSNAFLKDLFQDPRPDLKFALDQRVGDSFGFPSGHAQIAAAMWIWLAVDAKRLWVWLLAIVIAAGVCLSRLYLGVHDVEDVLGGALLGLATVVIFAGFLSPGFHRLQKLPLFAWLILIAAAAPALWFLWPHSPVSDAVPGVLALLFFWLLGHKVQQSFVGYQRHESFLMAALGAGIAAAVMFIGFTQLGKALALNGMDRTHVFVIQMAYMALVATVVVPTLFRTIGLSSNQGKS